MDPAVALKERVAKHLERSGQSATAFGLAVGKNTSLVARINSGRIGLKTIRAVSSYLAEQSGRARPATKRGRNK